MYLPFESQRLCPWLCHIVVFGTLCGLNILICKPNSVKGPSYVSLSGGDGIERVDDIGEYHNIKSKIIVIE